MKRATLIAFFVLPILALSAYVYYQDHMSRKVAAQMRADEEVMVQQAIQEYTIHEGKPPKSLDDLVTAGYLRGIPGQPMKYDIPVMPPALGHSKSNSTPPA